MCKGDSTENTRDVHDAGEQCPVCASNATSSSSGGR